LAVRPAGRTERRGAALVGALAILLVVAGFAGLLLSVHSTHVGTAELAVQRLRAEAAALAAAQLTLWNVEHDPNMQQALAAALQAGDTSFAATPLIQTQGDLAGATFRVDLWPGPDTIRLRATGTSGGAAFVRWAQMPMELDSGKPVAQSGTPPTSRSGG
jgi:Tfp pilus assembly protein PilX